MRDVLADINHWQEDRKDIALATVVETWGSAPRGVGAKMAHTADGQITGSVSGGCVEGAVYEAGLQVLDIGTPQLLHFGVADETAWDVGLACGGTIEVFVEALDLSIFNFIHGLLNRDEPFSTVTVIGGEADLLGKKLVVQRGSRLFGHISPEIDGLAAAAARTAMAVGRSERQQVELANTETASVELFIEVTLPAPCLVIIGGVHIAVALTALAKTLGYRTIVIDPRRAFGSAERFPDVDQLIQVWPDKAFEEVSLSSSTAVASLTHDPKIDDPALKIALTSPAFYVGALGSTRTHARRLKRLAAAGVSEELLAKIHGPIGLDIGAQSPEEIALSIMAQIVASRKKN